MIAGRDAATYGEAKNSWLTGTAAWNLVAATQWILGIRPEHDGLRVDPCIPAAWKGFSVVRQYRGGVYHVKVNNPNGLCCGVKSLVVDGRRVAGNLLPPPTAPGQAIQVEVTLGE
jgi:cellobiose phosphorylase